MDKAKFVYVTYISTTPEKLWDALINPEMTRQYWATTATPPTGGPAPPGSTRTTPTRASSTSWGR